MKKYIIPTGTKCRIYFRGVEWAYNNIETILPQSYVTTQTSLRWRNVGKYGIEQCVYEEIVETGEVKFSIWVSPVDIRVV